MFTGGGGGFGAINPGQGAMMLELTKPPAAADRPVSALDCGKPVSLVHCCPLELTTNGEQAATLVVQWNQLHHNAIRLEAALDNSLSSGSTSQASSSDSLSDPDLDLANAQGLLARTEQQLAVWRAFAEAPGDGEPGDGWARWCQHRGNPQTIECQASPILPGELLHDSLWQRAAGAVLTSATLSALGTFDRFRERSGVPADARWKQVASPFDPGKATFCVPPMTSDPGNPEAHTRELTEKLPSLISDDLGVLLLFTSRRQMESVVEARLN